MRRPTPAALIAFAAVVAVALGARSESKNRVQTAPAIAGTGVLMGSIVDARDGKHVADAEVTLGGAPAAAPNARQLTDADGQFVFLDLPKGAYTITAKKAGYADGAYGRRRPAGLTQTLALADGERLGDLKIPMWKYGAITGTIRDEAGDPMVEAPVRALMRTVAAGKNKLTPGGTIRTDDRGLYRIGSLVPGEYVVAVPSTQASAPESVVELFRNGRGAVNGVTDRNVLQDFSSMGVTTAFELFIRPDTMKVGSLAFVSSTRSGEMRAGIAPMPSSDGRVYVYPTQYYASAAVIAEATIVTVRSGEEQTGVDIQLKLSPSARVSGVMTGPDGPLMAPMTLVLDSDDVSTDNSFETATTVSDAAGRFTFLGVPPGQYQLRAFKLQIPPTGATRGAPPPARAQTGQAPLPTTPLGGFTWTATVSITVGSADIDGLAITLRPGFTISGRAEFVGATRPDPDLVRRMSATFDLADARPLMLSLVGRGPFDQDGQLSSYQLPPGRYSLRVNNVPAGWMLKSATLGSEDISNTPLKLDRDVSGVAITFTDKWSSISGQVQTSSGGADPSATVLIFPDDPSAWTDYGSVPRRLRSVRVTREAQFKAEGLPAGDYRVVAVDEEASANWQDPAVLQSLARLAIVVKLADAESRALTLKTTTMRHR